MQENIKPNKSQCERKKFLKLTMDKVCKIINNVLLINLELILAIDKNITIYYLHLVLFDYFLFGGEGC